MNTEIYIEGYKLEVSKDLSTLLNFAIDDVREFASRSTTFSKTIVLPGTANNNKLFGHIFNIGQSNDYDSATDNVGYNFNVSKSADCLIFQDQIQTFKGVLRLMEINISNGNIEYEVAVFGELASLNVALSGAFLHDLDFSAYDLALTYANIVASWDNPGGSGVYFPLVDYGTFSAAKHDWSYKTFRPALYVKEYLDKIFAAANFRFESDLFDTARFKHLVIPHNQKRLSKYVTRQVSASRNDSSHVIDSGTPYTTPLSMSSVVVTSSFTSTIADSRFTYVVVDPLTLTVTYNFTGTYKANGNGWIIQFKKNGVIIAGTTINLARAFDTTTRYFNYSGTFTETFTNTDYIELVVTADGFTPTSGTDNIVVSSGTLFVDSDIATLTEITYGVSIPINNSIPKNIRQIDFLVSIVKLFNLYVYEDRFDNRLIYFKPYIDFYSTDSANSIDWTYKLNREKPVKIKPMSEINAKKYDFKFKPDSDYYNEVYRKRYNQGYGDYTFTSDFEFAEQIKSLELIFSSTPLVGYAGEDKVYPTIFKRTGPDSAPVEENVDSNIRIMQTKKITGVSSWDILDGASVLTSVTDYGYGGHLDDPDAPSDDLNFGALYELFFVLLSGDLSATQWNIYWSPYLAEITNKDSRMITGNFYLTAKDIFELDFSKFIYMEGNLFRLNRVRDYNASKLMDCQVELLKISYLIY